MQNEILNTKISGYGIVCFILLSLSFSTRFLSFDFPWYFPFVCAATFASIVVLRSGRSHVGLNAWCVGRFYSLAALLPFVLLFLWSALIWVLGYSGLGSASRPISLMFQFLAIACLIFAIPVKYGAKSMDMVFAAAVVAYIGSFVAGINAVGFSGFLYYVQSMSLGSLPADYTTYSTYFEAHDICLSMPLFALYYLRLAPPGDRTTLQLTLALVISALGFKRIALGAFVIVCLLSLLLDSKQKRTSDLAIIRITQTALLFLVFAWVSFSASPDFSALLNQYGVHITGRDYIYSYFHSYVSFDPLNLGQGLGFCGTTLDSLVGQGVFSIHSLHNDLLRLLIEVGLVIFVIWLLITLVIVPAKIHRRYGVEAYKVSILVLVYAFITYTTDNTMAYIVFQVTLFSVMSAPLLASMVGIDSGRRGVNELLQR